MDLDNEKWVLNEEESIRAILRLYRKSALASAADNSYVSRHEFVQIMSATIHCLNRTVCQTERLLSCVETLVSSVETLASEVSAIKGRLDNN